MTTQLIGAEVNAKSWSSSRRNRQNVADGNHWSWLACSFLSEEHYLPQNAHPPAIAPRMKRT